MIDLNALVPRAEDTLDAFPEETASDTSALSARRARRVQTPSRDSLQVFAPERSAPTTGDEAMARGDDGPLLLVVAEPPPKPAARIVLTAASLNHRAWEWRGRAWPGRHVPPALAVAARVARTELQRLSQVTRRVVRKGLLRMLQSAKVLDEIQARGLRLHDRSLVWLRGAEKRVRPRVLTIQHELQRTWRGTLHVIIRHRFHGATAIAASLTVVVVAVSIRMIDMWPSRPLLAVISTPEWVPFAAPIVPAIEAAALASAALSDDARGAAPSVEPAANRQDPGAIQRTLNAYRDAMSILDVAMVKAVWPSADTPTLQQTFAALYDQSVEFDSCRISVSAATALAICQGSVSYVRNQPPRRRRTEARQWRFTLGNAGTRWIIRTVAEGE